MVRLLFVGVITIAGCGEREDALYSKGFETGCALGKRDAKRCSPVGDGIAQLAAASDSFSRGQYRGYHDCHRVALVLDPCVQLDGSGNGVLGEPLTNGPSGSDFWVDSCLLPAQGVCIEIVGYPRVDAWCDELGALIAVGTLYIEGDCPTNAIAACGAVGVSFGHEVAPSTLHFYAEWTGVPAKLCNDYSGELIDLPGLVLGGGQAH
jgi:hypothetical protein